MALREAVSMPKESKSEMVEVAKKELEGRGYVIQLSTNRQDQNLIGKVHVSEAGTRRTVAKFVSVWKVDDLELVFGLDAGEGIARDFLKQALSLLDLFKEVVPGMEIRQE
jgi:hypothetical protein